VQIEALPAGTDRVPHTVDPRTTAVLGIHWQHGIVRLDDPFGSVFGPVIAASGVLDRVDAVFRAARAAGSLVVHVNICNPPQIIVNTPIFHHASLTGGLACGSPEVQELEQFSDADDVSLDHHRASAFAGTSLAQLLEERGIDTVVLTGVATNVAVEGTAREAADRGYFVYVLEDCCVAGSEQRHTASIENMKVLTTGIATSASFLGVLTASATGTG
jgi:nicotinamidase-related amidase